jgi:arabinogalactan oligomer / maltooligosaccharide transport system permease protein
MSKKIGSNNLWKHALAITLVLFTAFPIYVVLVTSFDPTGGLSSSSLLPVRFSLDNYILLFTDPTIPYWSWMRNSLIIATATAVTSVAIGAAGAFAFSRLRFKGRKTGLKALLLIQVFPSFLSLSAIYVMMEQVFLITPTFGLGSIWGLYLIYIGGSLGVNVWLLKGFLDTIPLELDESARLDGASVPQVFWLIFLPLAAPVLAVIGVLSFIGTFNEFVLASLFLQDVERRTVAVGLQQFVAGQFGETWGPFAAGSIIASVPLVILFLSMQRFIIGGLTAGATKG